MDGGKVEFSSFVFNSPLLWLMRPRVLPVTLTSPAPHVREGWPGSGEAKSVRSISVPASAWWAENQSWDVPLPLFLCPQCLPAAVSFIASSSNSSLRNFRRFSQTAHRGRFTPSTEKSRPNMRRNGWQVFPISRFPFPSDRSVRRFTHVILSQITVKRPIRRPMSPSWRSESPPSAREKTPSTSIPWELSEIDVMNSKDYTRYLFERLYFCSF